VLGYAPTASATHTTEQDFSPLTAGAIGAAFSSTCCETTSWQNLDDWPVNPVGVTEDQVREGVSRLAAAVRAVSA